MTFYMPTDRGALADTAAEVLVGPGASEVSLNAAGLTVPLDETGMMQSADRCFLSCSWVVVCECFPYQCFLLCKRTLIRQHFSITNRTRKLLQLSSCLFMAKNLVDNTVRKYQSVTGRLCPNAHRQFGAVLLYTGHPPSVVLRYAQLPL